MFVLFAVPFFIDFQNHIGYVRIADIGIWCIVRTNIGANRRLP